METVILEPDDHGLSRAAGTILSGGLVAFPTETVFGLGADAFNEQAIARIFSAKERPSFDPLIVHVCSESMAYSLWHGAGELEHRLIQAFWPGPLTIVSEKVRKVPDIVTAGLSTVGVRMPDHPVAMDLIKQARTPIAAPSANRFGKISPTQYDHVMKELNGRIDAVVKGKTRIGLESTVIRIIEDNVVVLRPGGITVEQISRICRNTVMGKEFQKKYSPGHLSRHYAPALEVVLYTDRDDLERKYVSMKPDPQNTGIMAFSENMNMECREKLVLSKKGDLCEAAACLFSSLRFFEDKGVSLLFAQLVPDMGLGVAINDRLTRAAG